MRTSSRRICTPVILEMKTRTQKCGGLKRNNSPIPWSTFLYSQRRLLPIDVHLKVRSLRGKSFRIRLLGVPFLDKFLSCNFAFILLQGRSSSSFSSSCRGWANLNFNSSREISSSESHPSNSRCGGRSAASEP